MDNRTCPVRYADESTSVHLHPGTGSQQNSSAREQCSHSGTSKGQRVRTRQRAARCANQIVNKEVVGAKGFEPSTSWSRTRRASQAALRPERPAPDRVGPSRSYSLTHPAVAAERRSALGKSVRQKRNRRKRSFPAVRVSREVVA